MFWGDQGYPQLAPCMASLRPATKKTRIGATSTIVWVLLHTPPIHSLPDTGLVQLITEYSSLTNRPARTAVSVIFNTYNAPTHAKHNEI